MLKLWKNNPSPSHEELFLTYYSRLLGWAMQLTGQDRSKAEDLVHDVFIQFVVVEPELGEVENLEGYLFASMRNLLRSQMRRQSVALNNQLSLLDYDSAELGLRARDLRHDVRIREELELICHYASVRKETSRAGSALILRFYLGYYPTEISQIFGTSRQAVADLLSAARREAKVYLTHPRRLSFMRQGPRSGDLDATGATTEADFLLELRRAIFRSCQGICVPRRRLKESYRSRDAAVAMDTQELGHLVSCPRCLDLVNHELGLALLADRHPTDTIGQDQNGRGGGAGPGGPAGGGKMSADPAKDAVKRFRRRLKDVFEHEPKELHIAINGRILGSQSINSDINRQSLLLDTTEKLEFVEVFSEQGLRLFSLGIEPPPGGPFERQAQVTLSDNRSLSVSITFSGPCPTLEILYRDPTFRAAAETVTAFNQLDPLVSLPRSIAEAEKERADPSTRPSFHLKESLSRLMPAALPSIIWSRLGLVGAVVLAVLVAGFFLFRTTPTVVSAAELLGRSVAAEVRAAGDTSVVVHRRFNLAVRAGQDRRLIGRQRIEIWQNPARGLKVRRHFDEQDQLLGGEWRKADGSSIIYRKGFTLEERPAQSAREELNVNNAWLREPDPEAFLGLMGSGEQTVSEQRDRYVLSFSSPPSPTLNKPRQGSISLNRADMRPIEQTLVIEDVNGPIEFHFSETQFERRALNEVAALIFEPDAAFFSVSAPVIASVPPAVSPSPAAPSPSPSPILATADLEIEVLTLLDQVGATLGEEVSVSRTVDGSLQIAGVVEGSERKALILSALAPITSHPATRILIETSEEAQLRLEKARKPSEAVTIQIQETAPTTGTIGVDLELRRQFAANGTPYERLDEEINQYANRALGHSRQAMLHAWALRRLVQRFSANEVQSLDKDSRAKWLTMIIQHTQGFEREMTGLRAHLSLAFPAKAAADETASDATDEAGLARLILRMVELSTITDEAIRSAFTLSGGDGLAISSVPFWRTLSNAELLAQKIEQGAQVKANTVRILR